MCNILLLRLNPPNYFALNFIATVTLLANACDCTQFSSCNLISTVPVSSPPSSSTFAKSWTSSSGGVMFRSGITILLPCCATAALCSGDVLLLLLSLGVEALMLLSLGIEALVLLSVHLGGMPALGGDEEAGQGAPGRHRGRRWARSSWEAATKKLGDNEEEDGGGAPWAMARKKMAEELLGGGEEEAAAGAGGRRSVAGAARIINR